jgi:hypothetical protein
MQAKLPTTTPEKSLPSRMLDGLQQFNGSVLIILCEKDLAAQEFALLMASSTDWEKLIRSNRARQHCLAGANHTFSKKVWREQISAWTIAWVLALPTNHR